jgi:hypothetical protein
MIKQILCYGYIQTGSLNISREIKEEKGML